MRQRLGCSDAWASEGVRLSLFLVYVGMRSRWRKCLTCLPDLSKVEDLKIKEFASLMRARALQICEPLGSTIGRGNIPNKSQQLFGLNLTKNDQSGSSATLCYCGVAEKARSK